jgi:hypothetical protein
MEWYLKVQRGFEDMLNTHQPDKKEWAFMLSMIAAIALDLGGWTALLAGAPLLAIIFCAFGAVASTMCVVILWIR